MRITLNVRRLKVRLCSVKESDETQAVIIALSESFAEEG